MVSLGSFVICHLSLLDGEDVRSNDFSRSPLLFVVTTSVVASLLGGSHVTP
ncbi:MAG: hypothetical protein ACRC8Y_27190 [Chroococcales cyanobacterium]